MSTTRLIILDRDGVINQDRRDYVKTPDEWVPLPGALEAIATLTRSGFTIAVATNQSGIGRGFYSLDTLSAMHDKMNQLVEQEGGLISDIRYCPHLPDDHCGCRKPLPRMLQQIMQHFEVEDPSQAWMVGDSLRDLQAGEAAGTRLALVLTGNGEATRERLEALDAPSRVEIFPSLQAFADHVSR
ncbi:D-glycero-beta-D-manno-heptose-1,7-bisphosphate 7-phosphatase [Halomonadaceae bacterium LMG 33818]|uniref:D-glycero-beta-D-manno-heptose 1,7-bisphosphate 7-phosphatase n=1 Tax=Cernens ardua TaxID=3402176 RepID=UPI003EDBCF63